VGDSWGKKPTRTDLRLNKDEVNGEKKLGRRGENVLSAIHVRNKECPP